MRNRLQELIDSFIGGDRGGMFAYPDPRMQYAHPDPINTGGGMRLPIGGTNNTGGRYLPAPTPRPQPMLNMPISNRAHAGGGVNIDSSAQYNPRKLRQMSALMPSGRPVPDPFRR